ncbi:MAG: heavy-metal-associated domain-containing protein [Nanoarchaeota archaeon]
MNKNQVDKIIKINGMTCQSCVNRIESSLSKLEGIKKVKVSLPDDVAKVRYDSSKVDIDKIRDVVLNMGYAVDGKKKKSNFFEGLVYGLIPHTGCIAFIVASVLGVTVLMNLFRPLLMDRNIFYYLIGLSVVFATVSSALYLRKNGLLSRDGIAKKWKYLSTMYGTTVGINIVLFFLVFPLVADASTGNAELSGDYSSFSMSVDIPCPGHAPLITNELKSVDGVLDVKYSFPNNFEVFFDSRTTNNDILSIEVFEAYKPTLTSSLSTESTVELSGSDTPKGCGFQGTTCDGGCTGSCGCKSASGETVI